MATHYKVVELTLAQVERVRAVGPITMRHALPIADLPPESGP